MTSTPVFLQTPIAACAALLNGTGAFTFAAASNTTTNLVSLVAGGANGSLVEAITISSTDTSARDLILILNNGTYNFVLCTIAIPLNAGFTNAVAPVNLFASAYVPGLSVDANGNKVLNVPNGSTLYVGTLTAVTSAKQISVVANGGNF